MATRRLDTEAYTQATEAARAVRLNVAEQLRELVIDGDRMSSREEFAGVVERILFVERRLAEARGRQEQARELGLPLRRHVADEAEFKELLRETVMNVAVTCAGWVAAMDYELVRPGDDQLST